ncbi:MAG: arylsulfatase [Bacteroidota bacterium]
MKSTTNLFLISLVTSLFLSFSSKAESERKKPNVILIITDDQGYGDLACHGNPIIETPNMNELHGESVRLTDFHVAPTSAPTRAGLLSGANKNRAGAWHTIGGCSLLRKKFVSMPEVFNRNGYATGMFGKWHLGDAYPYLPHHRGFDEAVYHGGGGVGQTPDYWNNDYFDDHYFRNGEPEKFEGYCTDVFFEEALKFMDEHKEEPFFVYLSTNAPHSPLNVEEEYFNRYKEEDELTEAQKVFYGMITNIDDNLGMLEKKLKKQGLRENTILIFMTDNGTSYGADIFNAGMRGNKGSQYEGGHRVPFFIRWEQSGIDGGRDVEAISSHTDVLPTLIDLCNLTPVDGPAYDGRSLKPLLTGKTQSWPGERTVIIDQNRKQHPEKWRMNSVMTDQWRLIDGEELYNIEKDPGQKNNIASEHPEVVRKLRAEYRRWWDYVSTDFGKYEAYEIGFPGHEEVKLTCHDLHTPGSVAWNHSQIRKPQKSHLSIGYFMIDVYESGTYEISLRRWPRESGLAFDETPGQLGEDKPWYEAKPEGTVVDLEKAAIEVEGLHLEKPVDMSAEEATFQAKLSGGRQQFKPYFVTQDNEEFGAFYVYIEPVR